MDRIYDKSKSIDSKIDNDVTLKNCSCNSNTINSSGIAQVNETISIIEDISTNELKTRQCDNGNPVINNVFFNILNVILSVKNKQGCM